MPTRGEVLLEDLRQLTNKLHASVGDPDIVWPLDMGKDVEAYRLHREPRVAVLRTCIKSEIPFPRHIHHEDEILIVYDGQLAYKIHDNPPGAGADLDWDPSDCDGVIDEGGVLRIPANVPHSVMALGGDCWVIAVTVPASPGF
jgi:quercetin dioxygenase-like cupin family protein